MTDLKSDCILSDGREIVFDLNRISISEFRELLKPEQTEEEGDEILGRCAGLTREEVTSLGFLDYRRISTAFWKKVREPLADPL